MKTNDYSHLIEQYIFNQLSENEKKEVEILIESDPSFAEELAFQISLFETANDQDFKKILPKIKSAEKEYLLDQAKKSQGRSRLIKRLVFAACFALFIVISWQLFFNNNTKSIDLFTSFYEPFPMVLSFRGNNDLIADAVNSYNTKDFEMVIKSMNQLILKDTLGLIPYIYLGIAHLEMGDLHKAIENFELVSDSDNPSLRQQANWYVALTFLKANEPEKAKNILTELSNDAESTFNQEPVEQILDHLGI